MQPERCNLLTSENLLDKLNRLSGAIVNVIKIVYIENIYKSDNYCTVKFIEQLSEKNIETISFAQLEAIGLSLPVCTFEPPAPEDVAGIMYTSGTTGNPKGVIINHRQFYAYGSTEMTSASHTTLLSDLTCGSTGIPYQSVKYYLKDWEEGGYCTSDRPNPRGEIVVGCGSISSGYYKLPNETREAFFETDGTRWFLSGDIGEVMPNGTLKIIDRKKDLTKLPNGEFISLGKIESTIRGLSYVENICICTDPDHNYLVALISPNSRAIIELGQKLYSANSTLTFEQLCNDPTVVAHVQRAIEKLCKDLDFKNREIPAKSKLVTEEWSQENNLLTAAMKMKRKQVNDFYRKEIDKMFSNES